MVNWHDAVAYCDWLARKMREKGQNGIVRLPTEAEWEKAVRGTDGRIFPWGNEPDPERANYAETGIGTTSPVGCFRDGESPYSLLDMVGNEFEWTSTIWGHGWDKPGFNYPYLLEDGREDYESGSPRILRGGAYNRYAWHCRAAYRNRNEPRNHDFTIGFRLVFLPGQ